MLRALLATMAILLLYASSAAAECAWMLWEAVEVHTFGSSALPTTKTAWEARERAFGTYGDCAGAAQKRAKEQAAVSKTNPAESSRGWTALGAIKDGDMLTFTYSCWPDTVDPRGPKGGGR